MTDIQGQYGLIDFIRGKIKDQARINPLLLIDHDNTEIDMSS